jgi:hypothetical protein
MSSAALENLFEALFTLCEAYLEDKVTEEELRDTAIKLTEEWTRIETVRKAAIQAEK